MDEPVYNQSLITCPYCGWKDNDSWEFGDGEDEVECPNCFEFFLAVGQPEITFSSYPLEPCPGYGDFDGTCNRRKKLDKDLCTRCRHHKYVKQHPEMYPKNDAR